MSQNNLEWIWKILSFISIPVLGWTFKLAADLARAEYQRSDHERRIEKLEAGAIKDTEALTEIKGLIIELKTQNTNMSDDIRELKARLRP